MKTMTPARALRRVSRAGWARCDATAAMSCEDAGLRPRRCVEPVTGVALHFAPRWALVALIDGGIPLIRHLRRDRAGQKALLAEAALLRAEAP